ncbi:glycosyltransferase [Micrococcus luteus]|uniref:glycosyltransferase n=1 Tax=Micrococcus luteus TaxID=1270 RepID=UPI003811780A
MTDIRMHQDGDDIYAEHPTGRAAAWRPYADAAGEVTLLARQSTGTGQVRASGPGVRLVTVPNYHSLLQAVQGFPETVRTILRESEDKVMVLRLLEPLSILAGTLGLVTRRPMVSWMVNDPLSLTATYRKLTPFMDRVVRGVVHRSVGVVYLAEDEFPLRYPAGPQAEVLINSNVDLTPDSLGSPRATPHSDDVTHLITVGSNQTLAKGQKVILGALADLSEERRVTMTFVGGGRLIPELEEEARKLGLADAVTFAGQVTDQSVLTGLLDSADVFLLPSFAEGLPRVITEAQARGLPVIASDVGSISTQVPQRQLLPQITVQALAASLRDLLDTPGEYSRASRAGLEAARTNIRLADPSRFTNFLRKVIHRRAKDHR